MDNYSCQQIDDGKVQEFWRDSLWELYPAGNYIIREAKDLTG